MVFILIVNIVISPNVTRSYYIPFHIIYISILLLYITEVPWAGVSAGGEKQNFVSVIK